ncbi:MAG: hypothetical protein ACRD6R_08410 [Candidatus Polarisedimenticolia bacterium]
MPLDLDATLKEMAAAAARVLKKDGRTVRGAMKEVLEDRRRALRAITDARLRGEIDDEELEIQLRDEQLALEAGLKMVSVLSKAAAQKAANAALNVLRKAIAAAL